MHRLFVALRPPAAIVDQLVDLMEGVPAARWQDDAQLHLTLRFIGAVERAQAEDVALALSRIAAPAVTVRLAGVGSFDTAGAITSLWAGIAPTAPLAGLHASIDQALLRTGIAPDRRAYRPHITVARLARRDGGHPAVSAWLLRHAGLTSEPFTLDRVTLYESTLDPGGARYDAVAAWPLRRV